MTRWLSAGAGALVLAVFMAGAASGAPWPRTGGAPSRSGLQSSDAGQPPIVPAWARADAGIRTPIVITGGAGSGVQRVAYGTTAGAVHLQVLESGTPVGPEEG